MSTDSAYEDDLELELSDLLIHKNNHIQIPADVRHEYDLEECYADVAIGVDDRSFPLADAWVGERGLICIPKKQRRIYDVSPGDTVDLKVEGVIFRE